MKRTLIILLAVVTILSYAFMAIASGSDENIQVNKGGVSTTVGETEAQGDGSLVLVVGDTLSENSVDITYNSCEVYNDYEDYLAPESGFVVIRLEFAVKNNSDSDAYISMYDFECYADNELCDAWYYADDDLNATVSSGRSSTGAVYFEVPSDATEIEVEYETNMWTDSKAIFIVEI